MANVTGWYAEVSSTIVVPRMSATAVMEPPNVSVNSAINILAPRMSATSAMPTPALLLSTNVNVPRMAATAAMPTPAVSNAFNVSVTAPRMDAAATFKTPGVVVSGGVTVPRMAATAAMATPAVNTSSGANYTDLFNRANASTLGASWNTDDGIPVSLSIVANAAAGTSVGGSLYYGSSIYGSPMLTGNNLITLVMKGTPADSSSFIITARADNATDSGSFSTGVGLAMSQNGSWKLTRYLGDSGVSTSSAVTWVGGDTITFSAVGATLTVKKNGSAVLTTGGATDLAAGYIQILIIADGTQGVDSFTAQDI